MGSSNGFHRVASLFDRRPTVVTSSNCVLTDPVVGKSVFESAALKLTPLENSSANAVVCAVGDIDVTPILVYFCAPKSSVSGVNDLPKGKKSLPTQVKKQLVLTRFTC